MNSVLLARRFEAAMADIVASPEMASQDISWLRLDHVGSEFGIGRAGADHNVDSRGGCMVEEWQQGRLDDECFHDGQDLMWKSPESAVCKIEELLLNTGERLKVSVGCWAAYIFCADYVPLNHLRDGRIGAVVVNQTQPLSQLLEGF